jgi:hypothetical protein
MRHSFVFCLTVAVIVIAGASGHVCAQSAKDAQDQPPLAAEQPAAKKPTEPEEERADDEKPTETPDELAAKDPIELPPPLPIELALLRPDSLVGWTHAAAPPDGWSIEQGRLTGADGATPLLSGLALADFELELKWTTSNSARVIIELPHIPAGPVLKIAFAQSPCCGRITRDGKQLAPGKAVSATERMHSGIIHRQGDQLSVTVDGQQVASTKIAKDARYGLGLATEGGEVVVEGLRLRRSLGEPIFSGTDLSGWWCPGRIDAWQPIDGELVLAERGGNYLRTEKLYGNFTLSFEYKMKKNGNSGLGIRTPRDGWPSGDGMELQILDRPGVDKGGMMSIYRNVAPIAVAHRSEEWNQIVVQAEGRMISVWMNGELVQQVNTAWEPELKHRNLKGWIGFQDHGAKIQVRHLRLTEAPDGLGLNAWYTPRPESAVQFVLDRLMNSERLSHDDEARGMVVTAKVEEKGEHTLAELTGPGALVRVASDDWSGELALFFDGEEEPRIKCKARDLDRQVLQIPGIRGHQPLLTCLPFEKNLKLLLSDGGPSTYRFEYVQLPKNVVINTPEKPGAAIPKSLAAALDYRFHHHSHGVVRQHSPYLRVASDRKKLPPGEQADVVQADGAGLVQWVQLHCPKQFLETDDLWIEIWTAGESAPAVSAPIRYYFSGVAVAGGYGNYLLTERGGPINRLAIPFGNGMRMSLSNRGEEPIDGAGLTVSIQQPADNREAENFTNRLRLRGMFRAGADDQEDRTLFRQTGRGRWIGMVCGAGENDNTVIESLQIDGQPVADWQAADLDALLGRPGNSEEFRGPLSGRQAGLAWRYLLLSPVDFDREIVATAPEGDRPGSRLALFYVK